MKKVLLSLSLLAAMMTANAQQKVVGVGAYDDFNGAEYGTADGGIFWWPATDATYTLNRNVSSSGVLAVDVTKNTTAGSTDAEKYAPFGFGFGDDNGDAPDGLKFGINITSNPKLTFKYKASTGSPIIKVKLKDAAGLEIEVKASGTSANWYENSSQFTVTASQTFQTATFDFTGSKGVRCYEAGNPSNASPACTGFEFGSSFNFANVVEVDFFINPGADAYNGTITLDDVKFGNAPAIGLGTQSAAAKIASTRLYPNPSTSAFTAEVNLNNASAATIILSDMMGKQISSKSVDANGQANFETAGLANGIYTVTYVVDGTPAKSELVVVK